MKVAAIHKHGDLDEIKIETWHDPEPGEGEVLIDIAACGLNYLDVFVLIGMPGLPVEMPRVPGGDIAGTVGAVGSGVSEDWVGKRVLLDPAVRKGRTLGALGEDMNGGLCEKITIAEGNLIPLPDDVSFEQAAALPIAYGTAHRMMLARGRVAKGELVMILGASGGVGTACVQIAKAAGATVIACASSQDKLDRLKALGADHLINYMEDDFSRAAWGISGKKGCDLIVNYTGGDSWVPSLRALGNFGRMVTCGATAGFDPKTDIRYIWRREVEIIGSNGWTREDLEALIEKTRSGAIQPVIDKVLPLAEAHEGFRLLRDREVFGKVIINP